MQSEPEPAPQFGGRVSAEIGRLESLLVRVVAECSDNEDDDESGGVIPEHDRMGRARQSVPLSASDPFAHRTNPRPCAPVGARSHCTAVPPQPRTPPQVGQNIAEGASPRQRVANVYTRAAATTMSAGRDVATHPRAFGDGFDDSSVEAVLTRNIAEARQALGQLERCGLYLQV
eukprot:COSAG02_NODE_2452_length_8826_cov_16.362668_7_plen_174_part_00